MSQTGPRPARRTPMHYVAPYAAHDEIKFSGTELASIRRPIHTNHRVIRFQPVAHSHGSDSTGELVMDRALYSIEETRARLGGISRNSLYAMLRAGDLPSVIIGCLLEDDPRQPTTAQNAIRYSAPVRGYDS